MDGGTAVRALAAVQDTGDTVLAVTVRALASGPLVEVAVDEAWLEPDHAAYLETAVRAAILALAATPGCHIEVVRSAELAGPGAARPRYSTSPN